MDFVEIKNIYKFYQDIKILDDVSFAVPKGNCVSVSYDISLMKIIGGLMKADSGNVFVDGQNISLMDDKQLSLYRQNDVGMVFCENNLFFNITGRENIELVRSVATNPLDTDEINYFLKCPLDVLPGELSLLDQKKLAVAMAFVKQPKLLLYADSHDDYENEIIRLLNIFCMEKGLTVIIIK